MIEVKNLVKKYGNHLAVDHLNFTIEPGKIYGFLGPNGAGKSTTMNIMTGYIGATEGDVVINGHSITEEPQEAKKQIGYLPEIPPLYTDMKVIEYLKFAAELKGIEKNKREKAIQDAIELVKLSSVENRLIKNLSKGYKQRVGLAQAVLGLPDIIILDEPTVGLDPKQIIEIRDTIKQLGKKHTVILSSHILQEVSAVCDYIVIISHGKMVASDTPDNLERLMEDTSQLKLVVKGGKEDIDNILSDIDGVDSVEYKSAAEENCTDIVISSAVDVDLRERIFYLFAEHKLPILQMTSTKMTLEDVFLELTSDRQSSADESEDDTSDEQAENINKKEEE